LETAAFPAALPQFIMLPAHSGAAAQKPLFRPPGFRFFAAEGGGSQNHAHVVGAVDLDRRRARHALHLKLALELRLVQLVRDRDARDEAVERDGFSGLLASSGSELDCKAKP
jgi:hypothetical protein